MQNYVGNVAEFQLTPEGRPAARITCPEKALPAPGQYLLAYAPDDTDAPLATVLYPTERSPGSFLAAPPIPPTWQLGTTLHLRGPLGKGFRLPGSIRNLALVALGDTIARLLPLLPLADNVAFFLPAHLFASTPFLPVSIEINPLTDLSPALRWADFLVLDLPLERVPDLPKLLKLTKDRYLPCPAQALIVTPMPCGGIADCGVCAVGNARRYWLACKDGPVFDVKELITVG
ncbi:MAG: hypothetical protein H6636_00160 [Anaerolineales bacterium]|nr:hypothetical protein [Anaerolineales bacterium]